MYTSHLIAHRYKRLMLLIKCCVYFILILCFGFKSCFILHPCICETRFHVVILCIACPGVPCYVAPVARIKKKTIISPLALLLVANHADCMHIRG